MEVVSLNMMVGLDWSDLKWTFSFICECVFSDQSDTQRTIVQSVGLAKTSDSAQEAVWILERINKAGRLTQHPPSTQVKNITFFSTNETWWIRGQPNQLCASAFGPGALDPQSPWCQVCAMRWEGMDWHQQMSGWMSQVASGERFAKHLVG